MISEVALLICAAVTITAIYFRFNYSGRLMYKIPGQRGLPIFGNILDVLLYPGVRKNLFYHLRRASRDYGNINKLHCFWIRAVNIYDPMDIEVILSSTKYNEKRIPYTFLKPWLGQGLLINNGESWQHRRKLLTPAFHFNILKKFTGIFCEQTMELLDTIQNESVKDQTEIKPLISKYTLMVMCDTSMGIRMHKYIQTVYDKYVTALHNIGRCTTNRTIRPWLYIDQVYALTKLAEVQKSALRYLHNFTRKIIQERKKYRENNNTNTTMTDDENNGIKSKVALLDLLLDHEQQGKIDVEGIREEVDTFMFEGHDTTATSICFTIMLIANEPEIQENICQELNSIFGDSVRDPSMEDLAEMKYLECCIKESLRLYPSVPFMARHLTQEVVLSGYRVPAGTICAIHTYDVHRRNDLYADPEKFIPERFLPENVAKRHLYAYIPFSAGPRNCIGQKFAILQMKTLMSSILRKFRLEPVTRPEDCKLVCDIMLRTEKPIYVRFRNKK